MDIVIFFHDQGTLPIFKNWQGRTPPMFPHTPPLAAFVPVSVVEYCQYPECP